MQAARNTNDCPTPEQRLVSPEECAAAAEAFNLKMAIGWVRHWDGSAIRPSESQISPNSFGSRSEVENDFPKGCYGTEAHQYGGGQGYKPFKYAVHFNTHSTGQAQEDSDPLCFASVEIAARERAVG